MKNKNFFFFFILNLFSFLTACSPSFKNDQALVVGRLDNGLSYFIYPNSYPKDLVSLRLVVKVGSLMENEKQQGIAHFIEHMLFNGTKSFPHHSLIKFLESQGMRFGADLNAYTSFDQTVYQLDIQNPKGSQAENIKTALKIMREWLRYANFDEDEIEKERGIVLQEKLLYEGFSQRYSLELLKNFYKGALFSQRLPIGQEEQIKKFQREDFLSFYNQWYVPQRAAVVICGDNLEIPEITQLLKQNFSDLQGPSEEDKQNTKLTLKRLTENLSELEKPYAKESFASFSDKEIKTANLLIYKREDTQEQVLNALSEKQLTKQVLFWLFDRRIKEFLDQTSPLPFQGALMGEDLMAGYLYRKPILANVFRLDLYQGREKEGLRAFFQEYERLLRFGFTQEEWKLCQQSLLEDAKIAYENKDKRSSQSLAQELSALSLEESSLFPSMEEAFKALKVFLAKTRLKTINEALTQVLRGEDCLYFYSYNPEANSCLSKQDVLALREELKKTNLVPYVFKKSSQLTGKSFREPSLLPKSELLSDSSAFSSWILDNGIRIYFKRNTQIPKTVSMRALARGLVDLDTPQQWKEMYLGAELVNQSGWGELSRSQTKQFLLDKNLSLITTYSLQAREISGHFDWDSKEDFFQCLWSLVRLAKIDKSTLEEFKQNLKEELSKEQWDYKAPFRQAIRKALYANNPFSFDLAQIESTLAHLNLDRVLSFYKKQFDDLSNFSFIFVGDIEENEIIRLSAKYLGALEIKKENLSKSIKDYLPYSKGTYKRILNLDPEERATAFLSFTYNDLPLLNDLKEEELRLLIQALELAYSRLLLEEVREGLSGVYSINFLIINRLLENLASRGQVQVSYVSSPQKLDQVNKAVKKVLEKGQASAFNDETLDYVRKYLVKTYTKAYEENSYWLNYAIIQCLTKGDWKHSNIEDLIGIVEAKHLEELAKILIDWKALKEIYLLPKGKE